MAFAARRVKLIEPRAPHLARELAYHLAYAWLRGYGAKKGK